MIKFFETAFTCEKKNNTHFFFLVITNPTCNEADRVFIGRTGISMMNSYRKVLQWRKVRCAIVTCLEEKEFVFTLPGAKLFLQLSMWMCHLPPHNLLNAS